MLFALIDVFISCINTIDMALCIFIKDLLQWITYLFLWLLCFCDGFVNVFDICSKFVEITRNILCNQYNCYRCLILDKIDTCSINLYNCIYAFNTLLSMCTSIQEIIDTICFYLYSCSYLINNIAMDSYTSAAQS